MIDVEKYPNFATYAAPFEVSEREIVGRSDEVRAIWAGLSRPEMSSIALLGPAGVGKTAVVESLATKDTASDYFEVDLAKMGQDGPEAMAGRMKALIDDVRLYQKATNHVVVLFMDEFHQLIQLSPAATEAIKPILARSGQFKIKIIVATTFEEYVEFVQPNEALAERLQRITIDEPGADVTLSILRSMAKKYVPDEDIDESVFNNIIDVSNRYLPSEHQPRKSIKLLNAMIGYHIAFNDPMDMKTLNRVIFESIHVNTQWSTNVEKLTENLRNRVKGQDLAIETVTDRLQISIAGLADESRPQASMLFTGSTGTGKTELTKAMAESIFGTEKAMIRFDMSEYSKDDSVEDFRERIADAIREKPYAIVLLDEIEKASRKVALLLLQILDDGRLSDRYGRQVTFVNSYIILTTNLGAEQYEDVQKYGANVKEYIGLIREALMREGSGFPPELIGRIDEIVPFNPLTPDVLKKIAERQLKAFKREVRDKHDVIIHYDGRVILDYLVDEHFDQTTNGGGGRALSKRIYKEIKTPIAKAINSSTYEPDLYVSVVGKMSHGIMGDKFDLVGSAKIHVDTYFPQDRVKY